MDQLQQILVDLAGGKLSVNDADSSARAIIHQIASEEEAVELVSHLKPMREARLIGAFLLSLEKLLSDSHANKFIKIETPTNADFTADQLAGHKIIRHTPTEVVKHIIDGASLADLEANLEPLKQFVKASTKINYLEMMTSLTKCYDNKKNSVQDIIRKSSILLENNLADNYVAPFYGWLKSVEKSLESALIATINHPEGKDLARPFHDAITQLILEFIQEAKLGSPYLAHVATLTDIKSYPLGEYVFSHSELDLNTAEDGVLPIDSFFARLDSFSQVKQKEIRHPAFAEMLMSDYLHLKAYGLSPAKTMHSISKALGETLSTAKANSERHNSSAPYLIYHDFSEYLKQGRSEGFEPLKEMLHSDGWFYSLSSKELEYNQRSMLSRNVISSVDNNELLSQISHSGHGFNPIIDRIIHCGAVAPIRSEMQRLKILSMFYAVAKGKNGTIKSKSAGVENYHENALEISEINDVLKRHGVLPEGTPHRARAMCQAMLESKLFQRDKEEKILTSNNILIFLAENGLHEHMEMAIQAGHDIERPVELRNQALFFRPSNHPSRACMSKMIDEVQGNLRAVTEPGLLPYLIRGANRLEDVFYRSRRRTSPYVTPAFMKTLIVVAKHSKERSLDADTSHLAMREGMVYKAITEQGDLTLNMSEPRPVSEYEPDLCLPIYRTRLWSSAFGAQRRSALEAQAAKALAHHLRAVGLNVDEPVRWGGDGDVVLDRLRDVVGEATAGEIMAEKMTEVTSTTKRRGIRL